MNTTSSIRQKPSFAKLALSHELPIEISEQREARRFIFSYAARIERERAKHTRVQTTKSACRYG